MRYTFALFTATCLVSTAGLASAQTNGDAMSPVEIAVACSSPLSLARPAPGAPRIIGSQDTYAHMLFGPTDLLVINAGLGSGLQLNQRFFIRRENSFGGAHGLVTVSARTLGWIRIIAVDNTTAIAKVDHICDGIRVLDYLEPFVAPEVPADVETTNTSGDLDFSVLSRVVTANEERLTAAAGEIVMIQSGVGGNLTPGTRLAVYRDVRVTSMPLASIGEAVVVSVGPTVALARITRARDVVEAGDYMVVRK